MRDNNNNWRKLNIALLMSIAVTACDSSWRLESPSGEIAVYFDVNAQGSASYSVVAGEELVIRPSGLGLNFKGQPDFESDLRVVDVQYSARDQDWQLPWGERRRVRDQHREMLVTVENKDGLELLIRFRVFNDGVGFRYELPNPQQRPIALLEERTEFNIEADATAFWQPGSSKIRYEHLYKTTSLQDVDNAHTPFTVRLPSGRHLSIHEANLRNYSAFTLNRSGDVLLTSLRPWADGIAVRTSEQLVSSWRTVLIADDAAGLINSTLILNLNEPNELGDVSWIRPGKYVGIWWAIHTGERTWQPGPRHGATTDEAMRYIDFAASYGFDGLLVEGWNKGWAGEGLSFIEPYPDFDLQSVSEYARRHGVHLIGHHETYGDIPTYEDQLEDALDLYARVGVPQIKTGYVADAGQLRRRNAEGRIVHEWHDGQYAVLHHQRVVEEAAKRQISINTHEPVKDTGLRRTYPNWLTREGSRGQEFAIWGETPNPPEHTVLLAHTRMLAGPMDFTPGLFNLHPKGPDSPNRVQTTLAKQLALYVVIYSPVQMVPDLQENYEANLEAFKFIVDVPTDWEESIALAGEVGDFVVIARKERNGNDWYLGSITDEEARKLKLPLSFLDDGIDYIAEIYQDGTDAHWKDNPYSIQLDRQKIDNDSTLELQLAAGGGTAIRFTPMKEGSRQ